MFSCAARRAPDAAPREHLPIVVANMDLQFMHRAHMPRFGQGAFLVCLEALYKVSFPGPDHERHVNRPVKLE